MLILGYTIGSIGIKFIFHFNDGVIQAFPGKSQRR